MSEIAPPLIKVPRRITVDYIKQSPYYFIYSSSVHAEVPAGQASVGMLCKDKCFKVPVRYSQCRSSGFFQDNAFNFDIKIEIDVAIAKIPLDGTPIIPFHKIGEGFSSLRWNAEKSYKYLMGEIKKIAYPNIEYI